MVSGYFDGSQASIDLDTQPRAFCGLIGHEDVWTEVDLSWRKTLANPQWPNQPSRFHAFDCVHAVGDFKGWSYTFRHALYTDLMNLLIKADLLACGVVILPNAFVTLPPHVQRTFGSPDLLMMQHSIQTTITQANHRWPGEEVKLVFDKGNKHESNRAHWIYEKYQKKSKWGVGWSVFALGDSSKLTMLQAADIMAYGTYRYHTERYFTAGRVPDFRVAPIMERMVAKMASTGAAWDHNSLMDIFVRAANIR